MYGQGSGDVAVLATSAISTVAGVTVLPNTGDNVALTVVSLMSIFAGLLVISSFAVARIIGKINR